MLESLEQAFRRERQFTSDVSHELRTPVSVILAQCEASSESQQICPKSREKEILLIRKKAGEMSQMISQLLLLVDGQIRGGSS